jgi:hypothetical protein
LERLKVHRRIFAAPVDLDVEFEPVAFVDCRQAGAFDRRDVNECIRLSVIATDEAETLHRIEEFDGALSLFASQLALRAATEAALAGAALARSRGANDFHRLAVDLEVGRRDATAAVDQRELQRLAIGEVRKTCLLNRRDMDENILAAIVADDEAEALLRIEEFDDALAFANDLGRHSATCAAATEAATAAATEAAATAAATATAAISAAAAASAEAATVAEATAASRRAEAAAVTETAIEACKFFTTTETVALVTAATTAVTLTPSIETHEI